MLTDNLKLKPKKGSRKPELEGGKGANREERIGVAVTGRSKDSED